MLVKLKDGQTKEVDKLSRQELKEQIRFVNFKRIQKKEDAQRIAMKILENKDQIEQLTIETLELQEKLKKSEYSRQNLEKTYSLLGKHIKIIDLETKFTSVWKTFEEEQIEE